MIFFFLIENAKEDVCVCTCISVYILGVVGRVWGL